MTIKARLMSAERVVMEVDAPATWSADREPVTFVTPEHPVDVWFPDAVDIYNDGERVGRFRFEREWLASGSTLTFDPAGSEPDHTYTSGDALGVDVPADG